MRLLAITTYPPSQKPLSGFGYQAIARFLETGLFSDIIILADQTEEKCEEFPIAHLAIDRCWAENSLLAPYLIMRKVKYYEPDIIWLNLQYTSFGPGYISAFLGLLIPFILELENFPVIVLLHNFLKVVDLEQIGIKLNLLHKLFMNCADRIAMKSICSSTAVILMAEDYFYSF